MRQAPLQVARYLVEIAGRVIAEDLVHRTSKLVGVLVLDSADALAEDLVHRTSKLVGVLVLDSADALAEDLVHRTSKLVGVLVLDSAGCFEQNGRTVARNNLRLDLQLS